MFERLPTPWGLVRLGVAPDHPKIKSVSRAFEKIAAQPGFRFLGNVEVGRDIKHAELLELYDAVIYAVGAQSDRRMGIPGEDLPGSWPATEFVAWYNGHPDDQHLEFDLSCARAVVIGNGNVARRRRADARAHAARSSRRPTPPTQAIEAMAELGIEEIVMLGRRGPAQAAFTNPELLELGELAGADVIVDPADVSSTGDARRLERHANAAAEPRDLARVRRDASRRESRSGIVLRFLASPVELLGDGRVEGDRIVRNRLEPDGRGAPRRATDETETIDAGSCSRAIGYRGVALPGVPFDERRGTIPNERRPGVRAGGRLGVYTRAGSSAARRGVIGTNKKYAHGDGRAAAGGPRAGRLPPTPQDPAQDSTALLDERGRRAGRLRGLGARSTRTSARPASRTAARG